MIVGEELMLGVVLGHPPNARVRVDFAQICWKLRCSNSTNHCSTSVIHLQASPLRKNCEGSNFLQVSLEVSRG
jgi:hypothetical protein